MAAEICRIRGGEDGVPVASMRPRRMAAEIERAAAAGPGGVGASMRPRRMAAEIVARLSMIVSLIMLQ